MTYRARCAGRRRYKPRAWYNFNLASLVIVFRDEHGRVAERTSASLEPRDVDWIAVAARLYGVPLDAVQSARARLEYGPDGSQTLWLDIVITAIGEVPAVILGPVVINVDALP